MTDGLGEWVKSFWEDRDRPGSIEVSQVWTVFEPDGQAAPGAMLAVVSVEGEISFVTPLIHERALRTGVEPLLEKEDLDFDDVVVAVVEMSMYVSNDAFSGARFHGRLGQAGLDKIKSAIDEHGTIAAALSRLREMEDHIGPEAIPDLEIEAAFEAGALKLAPPNASIVELADLRRRLNYNLETFHQRALKIIGERRANSPEAGITFDRVHSVEEPEGLYRTMDDLLEAAPPAFNGEELLKGSGASLSGILIRSGAPAVREDVPYLRALIHARLKNWNVSENFFRMLLGSNRSEQGMRGVVWINQRQGDKDAASKAAAEIFNDSSTPGRTSSRTPQTKLWPNSSKSKTSTRKFSTYGKEWKPRRKRSEKGPTPPGADPMDCSIIRTICKTSSPTGHRCRPRSTA